MYFDLSTLVSPLWNYTTGDPRIKVAILDGPVNQSAPTLVSARLQGAFSTASNKSCSGRACQHGTSTASIILGTHNSLYPGIAPGCTGLIFPIFQDDQSSSAVVCSQCDLANGIEKVREQGAHIINISAGAFVQDEVPDACLSEAVARCEESGVLVVAATGNQGCECAHLPAAINSVLAVGATDAAGDVLPQSNWGAAYRDHGLVAPGKKLGVGALLNGQEASSGTSAATAVVSGIAALLASIRISIGLEPDPLSLRTALLATAERKSYDSERILKGRLNVRAALNMVLSNSGIALSSTKTVIYTDGGLKNGEICSDVEGTKWRPKANVLQNGYGGVRVERFGSTLVTTGQGDAVWVSDLHYKLPNGELGMYLLPIREEGPFLFHGDTPISGHALVDRFLRSVSRLREDGLIYALVSYTRPDEHNVSVDTLFNTYKRRLGHQHIGAYIGDGRTTHALPMHRLVEWRKCGDTFTWNVKGRPANVHTFSLYGCPQDILNRNCHIVDAILCKEILVPDDTESLSCKTYDLNTTLHFYRDWIRKADYLNDLKWYTNCADHKALVVNISTNLPHNPEAFAQTFGTEGPALWQTFLDRYAEVVGRPFQTNDETSFVPLWQLEGYTVEQIRPLGLAEFYRYHAALRQGRVDRYTGRTPLFPGQALAWKPETLCDMVVAVIETYLDVGALGGIPATLALLKAAPTFVTILGTTDHEFWSLISPVVEQLLIADAQIAETGARSWSSSTADILYEKVNTENGKEAFFYKAAINLLTTLNPQLVLIESKAMQSQKVAVPRPQLCLSESVRVIRESLNSKLKGEGFFYSPGAVQRFSQRKHIPSPFIDFQTHCTAMDLSELEQESSEIASSDATSESPCRSDLIKEGIMISAHNQVILAGNCPTCGLISPVDSSESSVQPANHTGTGSGKEASSSAIAGKVTAASSCQCKSSPPSFVYALGRLGYDFPTLSRRDSLQQNMPKGKSVEVPAHLLEYLESHPWDTSAVQWILLIESTPVYVIEPQGAFAREGYDLLRKFLKEQHAEEVERISIPGALGGAAQLRNGISVPVLHPEIRGMFSWTTKALLESVIVSKQRKIGEAKQGQISKDQLKEGVHGFLDRVYYGLRNLGQTSQERAINFAATNAFQIESVYEAAMKEEMELDNINVERNPIARPGADCWDVQLAFFSPAAPPQAPRKIYRFTVDVTDVVPVNISEVRSWSVR